MKLVEDDYTGPRAVTLGCPPPDVLMALGGDALPDDLRRGAEAHVASCAACRALVADLEALDIDVPASLDARVLPTLGAGGSSWRTPLLAMAAVVVAAVAFAVVYRNRQAPLDGVPRVDAPTATVASVAPATGAWEVRKPALLLPLATALVLRGEEEEASAALGAALAPYRTDDYVAAERLLEQVVEKYPALADAWFYLGSTRLLDGDPAGARVALTEARARGIGDRDDEAAWLLATADARLGDVETARSKLDALCAGKGAFRDAACNARTALR